MPAPSEIALIFDFDNTLIMSNIDFVGVRHRLIDMLQDAAATSQPRETLMPLALWEIIAHAAARPALVDRMWEVVRQAERTWLAGATLADGVIAVPSTLRARGDRLALLTHKPRAVLMPRLAL